MSMSDTCIDASRELLRYTEEAGEHNFGIKRAVTLMIKYVVLAEAATVEGVTDDTIARAIRIFRQHLRDTPDWTDAGVKARLDDFNVLHAALKDPNFKPQYESLVKH